MSITEIFSMGVYSPDNDFGHGDDQGPPNGVTPASPYRCDRVSTAPRRCWRRYRHGVHI